MSAKVGQKTSVESESTLLDRLSGVWVFLMGVLCLSAMAADMGLAAGRADGALIGSRILYVFVLVGLIACAVLRVAQRLRVGRDGS